MARSRLSAVGAFLSAAVRSPALARISVDAAVTAVLLRRRGLKSIMGTIDPSLPPADVSEARAAAARVDDALDLLPMEPTCLRRSVSLLRELHREGRSALLVIGVRSVEPTGVAAHAWVEADDEVVNDEPDMREQYAVIATGDDLGRTPDDLR